MDQYRAEESAIIEAPSHRVYDIIADYHRGHRAILPSRYFTEMNVIEGGRGAGTLVEVAMNVLGARARLQLTVSEPDPGRILQEEDVAAGVVTTFTVDPVNGASQSRVTIRTAAKTSPGLRGRMERLVSPAVTRRIYREELAQLAALVKER